MSKVDVIIGIQLGDEGKGKIVDVIAPNYKVVARFQGGPNAGHTLVFNEKRYVLHLIPSGIFRDDTQNLIGNGVVLDPIILSQEIENLEKAGVEVKSKLLISKKTSLILPTHRILDAASEAAKGQDKIGTTLKGISPTYKDKIARSGLRVGDVLSPNFRAKYDALKRNHESQLKLYDFPFDVSQAEVDWFDSIEKLKQLNLIDSENKVNKFLNEGVRILAEGAQGSLLDVDFGTYPFVTSSNTNSAGVCTGLGVAPSKIGEVFGVFKAYTTRVGGGPFPTELFDEVGGIISKKGKEFGATTGRARRCGWLDLVALKYSVMLNGVTSLIIMKADILNDFEVVKVAVNYEIKGEVVDEFPYELTDDVKPVYREFRGWKNIDKVRKFEDFDPAFQEYIVAIEEICGVPIKIISVGPDRDETVIRN